MDLIDRLSRGLKAYFLLALLTFAAAWPGVINMPALDRDEARFAQASRQMVQSGDYVTIRFQDELRNKKPAGIHWLQAASVSVFSDPDSTEIWPYRLPSLMGAIAAVCFCFWFGSGLVGRRAAFMGSSLFACSLLLTTEAHIAKTDAVLVATTCLLFGALSKLYLQTERTVHWPLIAWIGAAASMLIKGPVILGLAAATLFGLFAFERRANWMKPLLSWQGWGLFLILTLPWFILVQLQTGGAYLDGALGKDFADKVSGASEGHGGLPGYHTLLLWILFFPGTLFLVPALRSMISAFGKNDRAAPSPARFLSVWVLATWMIFEPLPTKLPHYVLPAYPALGLLAGLGATRLMGQPIHWGLKTMSAIGFVLAMAGLLVALHPSLLDGVRGLEVDYRRAGSNVSHNLPVPNVEHAVWWLTLVFALTSLVFFLRNRIAMSLLAVLASGIALSWHARVELLPAQKWILASEAAMTQLTEIDAQDRIKVIGYSEPSLVFLTNNRVQFVREFDGSPGVWLLNLEEPAGAAALEQLSELSDAEQGCLHQSAPVSAYNYSKGRVARFVLIDIRSCSGKRPEE